MKTTVLVIDDSAVMRKLISQLLESAADLQVVGTAADGQAGLALVESLKPDVLTLDVAMPRMGGLEFLQRLMERWPVPVVMVSAFTEKTSETTLKALELGAVDCVGKPLRDAIGSFDEYANELIDKVRAAKVSRPRRLTSLLSSKRPPLLRVVNAFSPSMISGGAWCA